MPDARFQFKGDLAATPLPEVLCTVHHYRVPGVLSAVRQSIEKKIYISNGDVIFATSGDRADSLGDYLLRNGVISQEAFDKSVEILLLSGGEKRHGEVLVEMGALTHDDLYKIVVDQVRSIVYSVFNWEEGNVTFQVGQYRTDELIQLNIPARQMVLAGVKATTDARRLVSFLGPSWTVFDPSFDETDLDDIGLSPAELALMKRVDGLKTLKDLVVLGPGDAAHNAKLVYAFYALRLITRRETSSRKKIQWKTTGGDYAGRE